MLYSCRSRSYPQIHPGPGQIRLLPDCHILLPLLHRSRAASSLIGKKALFEDVNIKFTEGNCYGLIGANGAGKSTFLKILSGVIEPSKGDIAITPGQRLSVLEQDHYKYDDYQVLDTVILAISASMRL